MIGVTARRADQVVKASACPRTLPGRWDTQKSSSGTLGIVDCHPESLDLPVRLAQPVFNRKRKRILWVDLGAADGWHV